MTETPDDWESPIEASYWEWAMSNPAQLGNDEIGVWGLNYADTLAFNAWLISR